MLFSGYFCLPFSASVVSTQYSITDIQTLQYTHAETHPLRPASDMDDMRYSYEYSYRY